MWYGVPLETMGLPSVLVSHPGTAHELSALTRSGLTRAVWSLQKHFSVYKRLEEKKPGNMNLQI